MAYRTLSLLKKERQRKTKMSLPNFVYVKLLTTFLNGWLKKYADNFKLDVVDNKTEFTITIKVFDSLQNVASKITKTVSGLMGVKK